MTLREAYELLALDPANASSASVRTAFRGLVRRVHPDTVQSEGLRSAAADRTRTLIEAYETIKQARFARPLVAGRPRPAAAPVRQLSYPYGIASDRSGVVYVTDWSPRGYHGVRKIDPSGAVTNVAGGAPGHLDGPATHARFYQPKGIAVDADGSIYVCDSGNGSIRKIDTSGTVTTLAGSRMVGASDGAGKAARFHFPHGIAVDAAGNVYVADLHNNLVRKISPAGAVTTLAGRNPSSGDLGPIEGSFSDGIWPRARFHYPQGVAVDAAGNVFVADRWNVRIRHIARVGIVTTLAGKTRGYDESSFISPQAVAVDAEGNVYVADAHRIRKVTASGTISTLAGSREKGHLDGEGAQARFNSPQGIAVDGAGNVFVADTFNRAIRRITPAGVASTLVLRYRP